MVPCWAGKEGAWVCDGSVVAAYWSIESSGGNPAAAASLSVASRPAIPWTNVAYPAGWHDCMDVSTLSQAETTYIQCST